MDGIQVGDWESGSAAIGLSSCGIGSLLVYMFVLLAIRANNYSIYLYNSGGPRAATVYKITMTYLQLCETGSTTASCLNPLTVGSGDSGLNEL